MILSYQDGNEDTTIQWSGNSIISTSNNGEGCIFDLNGNSVKKHRAFCDAILNGEKIRMLIPSDNLNIVEYYDENWKLINTVDISFMEGNIQSSIIISDSFGHSLGLMISNKDTISVITPSGDKHIAYRKENEALGVDSTISAQCSTGKYYLQCQNYNTEKTAIYSLSDHKVLFTLDNSINLDGYCINVKDKTYWGYNQYHTESKETYYGLLDENGDIIVDGTKEKFIKRVITNHSGSYYGYYSYVHFEKDSGEEIYYYGNPITAHAEEPSECDIVLYIEKIDDIYYKHTSPYYEKDDEWFDEIVLDALGNVLCESKKNNRLSLGFLTNEKYIVKVEKWWNEDNKDTEDTETTQTPTTATPSQAPVRTPEPVIPNFPIVSLLQLQVLHLHHCHHRRLHQLQWLP